MIRCFFACLCLLLTTGLHADPLRLAVTTSFENSGLARVLVPQIRRDTGIDVQLLVVGTGQAIRLGQAGDVDAILVHSRAAEDAFIAQGHGTHRREIMYNDFVVVGPKTDPAQVADTQTAQAAMTLIHDTQSKFVSRGDDSGTHKAEQSLWQSAGLTPSQFGPWYNSVGAGMGSALNTASGLDAYILADRASWLNFQNKGALALLFADDPALFNQYAFLPVNPAKGDHINHAAARKLETWLLSDTARDSINGYKIDDEALFVFNGDNASHP